MRNHVSLLVLSATLLGAPLARAQTQVPSQPQVQQQYKYDATAALVFVGSMADALYRGNGIDNNGINFDVVSNIKDLKIVERDVQAPIDVDALKVELKDNKAIKAGLKKCVFWQTGAYGNHLTTEIQETLTDVYLHAMKRFLPPGWKQERDVRYYLVDNATLTGDILYADCLFLVVYRDGTTLAMEGYTTD